MKPIYVTRPSLPEYEEYIEEIKSIFEAKWVTNMGEKHQLLEKKLEEYLDVPCVSLITNGHMALEIALESLEMEKGGEIITTPFTFVSTTNSIVRSGFKPVFCDVNDMDYTIDVKKIESLITDKTVAVLPVHVYGNICDVGGIQKIADNYGLKVIYDAAHAFGVKYKDKGITQFGDISILSFHATKVYNTIEGGAICSKDKNLKEKIFMLRDFGIQDEESVEYIAPNAKMNEFQAAMGLCNLRRVDQDIQKRKSIVNAYYSRLMKVDGVHIIDFQEGVKNNYAYFPIVIEEAYGRTRDELVDRLKKDDIFVRKYFYPIVTEFDCYSLEYDSSKTPVALDVSCRIITLPLYSDLSMEEVGYICDKIEEYGRSK